MTKASNTGGLVDARTVKEQLPYEIHDPAEYLTPDVVPDVSDAEIKRGDAMSLVLRAFAVVMGGLLAACQSTGVVDNTPFAIANLSADNLLVWVNANQVRAVGVGVLTRWSMEAKNAAGLTSYSDAITIGAGDTSCGPLP